MLGKRRKKYTETVKRNRGYRNTWGRKKEDEGLKAAEEFLEKQKPKKKAGRPKKIQQKGA